jgi:iron complex outermembrane receptor protein
MTRNVLNRWGFIRVAFAAVAGLPLMIAASAYAQNPAASPAGAAPAGVQAETERVIVTGSNIPTAEEVGPNPVLSLNRDYINKSSERTVEQMLKDLPIANANAVPVSNNGTSQGGPAGTSSVSLRAFDPTATLVLVDGLRIVPFPAAFFFDLNSLPLTAVNSIEILKDGASATYGADAVAGVVNFKLYKDYRGAQVDLYYGDTLDKDAGIYSGDLLFGTGDDKMSIVGDVFFFHHNSLFAKDRGDAVQPPFVSSNASPYNLQVSKAVAVAAGGTAVGGTSPVEFAHAPINTNGFSPASAYTYSAGRSAHFNFNLVAGLYPTQERWGGYAAFNDKICDDQVQLYGDFFYDDVKTHDELAPSATGSFFTPGQTTIAIPPHMSLAGVPPPNTPRFAGQPAGGAGETATNVPANAFNPFNPFGQILSGGTRGRLSEFGNRFVDNENINELFTLGVKGDKLFDGNWGYNAAFRFDQIEAISQIQDASVTRFNQVLNAADPIFTPGSATFIGTTIPFDPFDSFRGAPVPSNSKVVNYARLKIRNLTESKIAEFNLNIYTTDLFDLPGGPVGLAFGGEFRREDFTFNPDDQARLADEVGVSAAPPSRGGRKDYAFYAETNIPIFSPEQGIWGFHSLEFDAASRFEEFRNNDTNVLVPKVEIRWQPFNDELTIRSTWSEGFLEPTLFELYSSAGFVLLPTVNPTNGARSPETNYETTGNKNLKPEDSRAWTGGFVYTPKWIEKVVPNLTTTATVDLYDIERTGVTTLPPPQEVVNRFFRGALQPGESVVVDPASGTIEFVKSFFSNFGRQESKGADFSLLFTYQTPNWGTFSWLTQATYLESFIYQAIQGPHEPQGREVAGQSNGNPWIGLGPSTGGDGFLKWKGVSRLDWTWHNFDLNWTVHYMDGFHESVQSGNANPANRGSAGGFINDHYVKQTWFFDCQASYDLIFTPPVESQPVAGYSKGGKEVMTSKEGKQIESTAAYTMPCWKTILNNTKVTIGCNDVFGQDPPRSYGIGHGNAQYFPGYIYDDIGRFVYVELTKKF